MLIPDIDRGVIEPRKLTHYLLAESHPKGAAKAAFFGALGYRREEWTRLRDDLLTMARTTEVLDVKEVQRSTKYEVLGTITGPNGASASVHTVWIVDGNPATPRLVTAYPGARA